MDAPISHVSFSVKKSILFYATGMNYYDSGKIHAEVNAINNLPHLTNGRKKVNLFVFRTHKNNSQLSMARPCLNCQNFIKRGIENKGYRLHNILYTDYHGNICKL